MCWARAARYVELISGAKVGGKAAGTSVPRDMEQTLASLQDRLNGGSAYGTRSICPPRRQVYRKAGNLRAVQFLLEDSIGASSTRLPR